MTLITEMKVGGEYTYAEIHKELFSHPIDDDETINEETKNEVLTLTYENEKAVFVRPNDKTKYICVVNEMYEPGFVLRD